jgi:hypothetical protein
MAQRDRYTLQMLLRRWVIERTFAQISRHRRNVRDYERGPSYATSRRDFVRERVVYAEWQADPVETATPEPRQAVRDRAVRGQPSRTTACALSLRMDLVGDLNLWNPRSRIERSTGWVLNPPHGNQGGRTPLVPWWHGRHAPLANEFDY